jgi:uncharacterized protein
MMFVESYLDKSPLHGIGVYAKTLIPKGTLIWEFTPGFDAVFSDEALAKLLPLQRDIVLFYCYREPGLPGVVLCCDNARHYNFDDNPNSGTGPTPSLVHGCLSTFALRDIQPGEELTYAIDEDEDAARKLAGGDIVTSAK